MLVNCLGANLNYVRPLKVNLNGTTPECWLAAPLQLPNIVQLMISELTVVGECNKWTLLTTCFFLEQSCQVRLSRGREA